MKTQLIILALFMTLASCFKHQKKTSTMKVSQNKASVKTFFTALENENVDQLVQLFAEDGRHINPYASGLFPEGAHGNEEIKTIGRQCFQILME